MFPAGETVTRLRATSVTDGYGNEGVLSWDAPTELAIYHVGVEPRPSSENQRDARNAVTSGFTLYITDTAADVTPLDRMRVRGRVYQVQGEPALWRSPFTGWAPGLVVQVDRVEG